VKLAFDSGDEGEANRLLGAVQAYHASGAYMSHIRSGPQRLLDVMIDLAEAHEALGHWQEALNIYVDPLSEIEDNEPMTAETTDAHHTHQSHKILTGTSRCMYQLGLYENAVAKGEEALAMGSSCPGVNKLVALLLLALGKVEAARTTMRRGVVYETPWDDKNQQQNIAFLQDCLRDKADEAGV
jgi:tetratricopeptide (TPR) repeat protein